MKNLLALVGTLVVTFAVAGWYLGWYQIQSTPTPSGHREVDVDLNAQKIRDDLEHGVEKIEKVIQHKNANVSGTTTTVTTPPGSTTPQTFSNGVTVRPNQAQPADVIVLPGGQK